MKTIVPESVELSTARLQCMDRVMQGYVDQDQLAGLITVLMRRGEAAHFAAYFASHFGIYGQIDIEAGRPMRQDAIFRIFSMTKPLTSLAVLMLYKENAFHLQYPISMFIPELANLKVLLNQMDVNSEQVPGHEVPGHEVPGHVPSPSTMC
jgi:CubicO group peptidase (beta-lactamase class C family)